MSKYARFAHLQLGGQAADGKAFQSLRRRYVYCDPQNLVTSFRGLIGVVEGGRFHRTIVLYSTVVLSSTTLVTGGDEHARHGGSSVRFPPPNRCHRNSS